MAAPVAAADERLVRALHDEHAAPLWGYVVSLTGDPAAAHDIVQETLLRAWRTPPSLDPTAGSVRSWLFTVARRLVIDDYRRSRARPETLTDDVPDRPGADHGERVVDERVVAAALRQLSPEHRAVLVQCYYRGCSVAQAAQVLGIPPGTVKSRTHYALQRLRLALAEMGVEQ